MKARGSREARMRDHGDLGSRLSTRSVPALRGRGVAGAATERIAGSVTERRPRAILSVRKSSVSYSRAQRDQKTLMDTTHSTACQQCQHTDKSCHPCYSDKGVMACERCSRCKMCCSHVGGIVANTPTTDIAAWMAAVRDGAEAVADALDRQAQTFGALLDCQMQSIDVLLGEVRGMRAAVDRLSASGVSSSQAAASTVDVDEDEDEDDEDVDRAAESIGAESGDDKDGERVDIALVGTGADLGESAEEEEAEAEEDEDKEEEAEGSGPACAAEAEMFTPPTPSGRIRMPRPTMRSWKGKEVDKMHWE